MVVLNKADLHEGAPTQIAIDGDLVCVAKIGNEVFAIGDTCSHSDASLSEGEMNGYKIECWLHGAEFDMRSGEALTPPAVAPVRKYNVKDNGTTVEIG